MTARQLAMLASLALLLAACGAGEHEDIKKWMAESSKDLRGKAPPLPELIPFPAISYSAAGEQDPFSPGRVEPEKKAGGGKAPDLNRPREQLENYPLEALSYIGLVSKRKGATQHALIRAEDIFFQVGKGSYMGQNFGRIVEISETEIMLVETVQDPSGQTNDWVERQVSLQLQDGTQGKETGK